MGLENKLLSDFFRENGDIVAQEYPEGGGKIEKKELSVEERLKMDEYLASVPSESELINEAKEFISAKYPHITNVVFGDVSFGGMRTSIVCDNVGSSENGTIWRSVMVPAYFSIPVTLNYHIDDKDYQEKSGVGFNYSSIDNVWKINERGLKSVEEFVARKEIKSQVVLSVNVKDKETADRLYHKLWEDEEVNSIEGVGFNTHQSIFNAAEFTGLREGRYMGPDGTIPYKAKPEQEKRLKLSKK